jgi:hypothetical protein
MSNQTFLIVGCVVLVAGIAIGYHLSEIQKPVEVSWGMQLVEKGVSNLAFGFGVGCGYAVGSPA